MSTQPEPTDEAERAQEQAKLLRQRASVQIIIGTVTYMLAMAPLVTFQALRDTSSSVKPLKIVLSMDFGDAAAILGVLSGLIIAVNVIVWQSIRGNPDPRSYAYTQLMAVPAYFVGQAAIFVAISTVIGYAPHEIDLPRLSTVLIACAAVVAISIHTSDGLDNGVNLAREIRVKVLENQVAQLENVLLRWSLPGGAPSSLFKAVARDLAKCAVLSTTPLLVFIAVRGIVSGVVAKTGLQILVVVAVWALIALIFGALLTLGVRYFVTRSFGWALSYALLLMLFTSTLMTGVVLVMLASGHPSAAQIVGGICFVSVPVLVLGLSTAGLIRADSGFLPGTSLRWVVRNGVERELRSRQRFLGTEPSPPEGTQPGCVRAALRKVANWYRAATGLTPTV